VTRQPALFATAPVPHPGSPCCDPAQDLAGWIAAQRSRSARDRRWVRVLHGRGHRLDRLAVQAYAAGDNDAGADLDAAHRAAHGRANGYAQQALMRDAHTDRVEAAHPHRLGREG